MLLKPILSSKYPNQSMCGSWSQTPHNKNPRAVVSKSQECSSSFTRRTTVVESVPWSHTPAQKDFLHLPTGLRTGLLEDNLIPGLRSQAVARNHHTERPQPGSPPSGDRLKHLWGLAHCQPGQDLVQGNPESCWAVYWAWREGRAAGNIFKETGQWTLKYSEFFPE